MAMNKEGKYYLTTEFLKKVIHYGKSANCVSYFRTRFTILTVTLNDIYTNSFFFGVNVCP